MTYKTTKKQIKTKLTTRTSLFGVAVIMATISLVSVDGFASDGQSSSFVAMAQTALWQLGDANDIFYDVGNVGIGTTNPPYPLAIEKLDTYGTMLGIGHATTDNLYFGASNEATAHVDPTMYGESRYFGFINTGIDNSDASAIVLNHVGYQEGTDYFRDTIIADGKKEAIAIFDGSSKNVGIGIISPSEKLDVDGNIKLTGNILSDGNICIGNCP